MYGFEHILSTSARVVGKECVREIRRMYVQSRSVVRCQCVRAGDCATALDGCSLQVIRDRSTMSLACDRRLCKQRVVCAGACGHAICAILLEGCPHQVIWDRFTVSFACDGHFFMRGVRHVPLCAGMRFVQDHLTGAHVR